MFSHTVLLISNSVHVLVVINMLFAIVEFNHISDIISITASANKAKLISNYHPKGITKSQLQRSCKWKCHFFSSNKPFVYSKQIKIQKIIFFIVVLVNNIVCCLLAHVRASYITNSMMFVAAVVAALILVIIPLSIDSPKR
mmetsp:Transcript_3945/g.4618  ORF Transcript_3945/g.4618 Transcript_3945/m.4618 type:complete len:141 (-) Transcript_3945:46-468(-)